MPVPDERDAKGLLQMSEKKNMMRGCGFMKLGLAYFSGFDRAKVDLQRQMGLRYVISGASQYTRDFPNYSFRNLLTMKKAYEDAGLELAIIEGPPALDKVKLGLPGAEEELEHFKEFIVNCGKLNIRTVCYNWMPVLNWFRTHMAIPNRGGATVTGFDIEDVKDAPDTWAGKISKERLWGTLEGFLKEVVPVCEEANVNLALHPDDPPVDEVMGISRILTSADAFQKVFGLCDSPRNGMTFCQGCFATMGEDVPATIRRFGAQKKIYFVHFRDVQGDRYKFNESFHDDGITDMYAAMKAYYEVGFEASRALTTCPPWWARTTQSPAMALTATCLPWAISRD